jgi:hypothetical protein
MAHCAILKKKVGEICILPRSACMWQDRITNACKYDPITCRNLTVEQYCHLVNQVQPSDEELERQKQILINEVKNEISVS